MNRKLRNLKRITGGILAAGILATGSMAFAYDPYERLEKYNIMQRSENTSGYVTREEAAKIIAPALCLLPADGVKGEIFTDVNSENPAIGYYFIAKQSGIINGYPDGSFRPNENITYAQAMKILICLLGYEPKAQSVIKTGNSYPQGYIQIAEILGLTEKVNKKADDFLMQEEFATLVDFALDIPLMVQTTYSRDAAFEVDEESSLIKTKLDPQ